MASGMKRVEEKKPDWNQIINSLLDQAVKTREGFKPEVVKDFEDAADKRSQQRKDDEKLLAKPSRQVGAIVAKRNESEPVKLTPHMEAAMELGKKLDLAALGKKLVSW